MVSANLPKILFQKDIHDVDTHMPGLLKVSFHLVLFLQIIHNELATNMRILALQVLS